MVLFNDIERTFSGPAGHNENIFDYYQRSARNDISIIRNKLNEWFQNYPENDKNELKSSFRKHFDDCFFELFLFNLFQSLNFEVEIHPTLPNSSKRPDFLLKKGDLEIYAEAKIVKNKSREQEALERKINQFYDDFSKIKLKGFMLCIDDLIIKNQDQPSTKPAINHIESEIQKLDPDLLTKELEIYGNEHIPLIEFENKDLHIIVKPMPIIPSARNIENISPIGIYPSETFWGAGEETLRESINNKAKRYGKFDKPFIVCMNSLDFKTSGKIDVENAIWGSLAISWTDDPNNSDVKMIREKDGVFLNNKGAKLKNLSGVFVTKINPHNIPNADYWLFKNPFSTNTLDFSKLGLVYNYVENRKIYDVTGNDLDEILKISKEWLNE